MGFELRVGYCESNGRYEQVEFPYETATGYLYRPGCKAVKWVKAAICTVGSPAIWGLKVARDFLALVGHGIRRDKTAAWREFKRLAWNIPLAVLLPGSAAVGLAHPQKGHAMTAYWMRRANCQETAAEFWKDVRGTAYGGACVGTMYLPICFQPVDSLARPFTGRGQEKDLAQSGFRAMEESYSGHRWDDVRQQDGSWTFQPIVPQEVGFLRRLANGLGPSPAPILGTAQTWNTEQLCQRVIWEIGHLPEDPIILAELQAQLRIEAGATLGEAIRTIFRTALGHNAKRIEQAQLNQLARIYQPISAMQLRADPWLPWKNVAVGIIAFATGYLLCHFSILAPEWAQILEILGGVAVGLGAARRVYLYCQPAPVPAGNQ